MKWSDIKDGVWTIATEKREKGNAGALRLPPVAVEIIAAQDEIVGNRLMCSPATRRNGGADGRSVAAASLQRVEQEQGRA